MTNQTAAPQCLDLGDTAFTIEFGHCIDPALQSRVHALDLAIADARQRGGLTGLIETVPTFRSLTVIYDPLLTDRIALGNAILQLLDTRGETGTGDACHWRLPACYSGDAAPDLEHVAARIDSDTEGVIALHVGTEYVVYMLGFLPGFPFMGDLPEPLRLPRRTEPRVRVPAGSVAIATGLTAIYPWESPGGWHLIGRCPVRLFNPARPTPALLQPGDRVRFFPVAPPEYASLARDLDAGRIDPQRWCHADTGSRDERQPA